MKTMKKITAVALLAVFMFTMNLGMMDDFGAREAEAAGSAVNYTITINEPSDAGVTLDKKEFTAYRLFDVTTYDVDTKSYQYKVSPEFVNFKYSVTDATATKSFTNAATVTGADLLKYVQECVLKDGTPDTAKLDAFANAVMIAINGGDETVTDLKSYNDTASGNTATINVDKAGYYLVAGQAANENSKTVVASCALTTAAPTAKVTPKVSAPTFDKKIVSVQQTTPQAVKEINGNAASAQIGDIITFELTATVPEMQGYNTYKMVFKDTLSTNMDFVDTHESVSVQLIKNQGQPEENKTLSDVCTIDGKALTVTLNDIKADAIGAQKGDTITVTYKVKLTNGALGTKFEKNTANLTYSSNPMTADTVTSVNKTNYIYDYSLDINKVSDQVDEQEQKMPLSGAQFALYRVNAQEQNEYCHIDSSNGNVTWVAKDDDTAENLLAAQNITKVTTESGKATFEGLTDGTYYLKEIKAPDGYTLLGEDKEITRQIVKSNWTIK